MFDAFSHSSICKILNITGKWAISYVWNYMIQAERVGARPDHIDTPRRISKTKE